jgi:predicted aldo/keto reductase-like oxidoreductase
MKDMFKEIIEKLKWKYCNHEWKLIDADYSFNIRIYKCNKCGVTKYE